MKSELRLHFPRVHIRAGVLALFALAMQTVAIFAPLGFDDIPKRLIFELSYVVLIFFAMSIFLVPAF